MNSLARNTDPVSSHLAAMEIQASEKEPFMNPVNAFRNRVGFLALFLVLLVSFACAGPDAITERIDIVQSSRVTHILECQTGNLNACNQAEKEKQELLRLIDERMRLLQEKVE